ncbi:helix-turn-helix transcriptional regulator [Micromonospora sp. R77]|uniref:helix-turn-helix domain-containing protein n=1 Tax=Micromonospora sp. R77 TaxID=2925836 RepID=UPI001F62401A|nr:helix-turn-helix transcriptional regulator [Micromonospora sp. R77]MCI4064377.1 helix-turn-helix transcriptional regulator [Micromonospora sp. R77]
MRRSVWSAGREELPVNEVLRVAMAERGETVESLAQRVGVDPKTVGRWLSPGRVPHPRTRLAVAGILGREPAELWPEPYRRRDLPWFRPWAELEQDAVSIRSYQPAVLPGLVQTEEYARAVLRTGGLLAPAEVEQFVAARLARQAVLDREPPPQLVIVVDEAVLCRTVGDRGVMARQLAHLATVAGREHVQVRVIPADGPWHTGLAGAFVLARLPDGTEVAYLDNQLRGELVTERADIASLGRRWESMAGEALPARRSIALIREAVKRWT